MWLLVALGAVLGAPARFLLDRWLDARTGSAFPWGTLSVNVLGSFVIGVLAGTAIDDHTYAFAGIGFCGAFTTFSTFAFETDRLAEDGALPLATINVVISAAASFVAVALGWWLGSL